MGSLTNSIAVLFMCYLFQFMSKSCAETCPQKRFQSCLGKAIDNRHKWQNCDMCVCENLNKYGGSNCENPQKNLLVCQLKVDSQTEVGCRLVLKKEWIVVFSFLGVLLAVICLFLAYYFYGYQLYKEYRLPVLAEPADTEHDRATNDADVFHHVNPSFNKANIRSGAASAEADENASENASQTTQQYFSDNYEDSGNRRGGSRGFRNDDSQSEKSSVTKELQPPDDDYGFDSYYATPSNEEVLQMSNTGRTLPLPQIYPNGKDEDEYFYENNPNFKRAANDEDIDSYNSQQYSRRGEFAPTFTSSGRTKIQDRPLPPGFATSNSNMPSYSESRQSVSPPGLAMGDSMRSDDGARPMVGSFKPKTYATGTNSGKSSLPFDGHPLSKRLAPPQREWTTLRDREAPPVEQSYSRSPAGEYNGYEEPQAQPPLTKSLNPPQREWRPLREGQQRQQDRGPSNQPSLMRNPGGYNEDDAPPRQQPVPQAQQQQQWSPRSSSGGRPPEPHGARNMQSEAPQAAMPQHALPLSPSYTLPGPPSRPPPPPRSVGSSSGPQILRPPGPGNTSRGGGGAGANRRPMNLNPQAFSPRAEDSTNISNNNIAERSGPPNLPSGFSPRNAPAFQGSTIAGQSRQRDQNFRQQRRPNQSYDDL